MFNCIPTTVHISAIVTTYSDLILFGVIMKLNAVKLDKPLIPNYIGVETLETAFMHEIWNPTAILFFVVFFFGYCTSYEMGLEKEKDAASYLLFKEKF